MTETRVFENKNWDEPWLGAKPGWYWGYVEDGGKIGDASGPFPTAEEAESDMRETAQKAQESAKNPLKSLMLTDNPWFKIFG
jgi:hypothetical protein